MPWLRRRAYDDSFADRGSWNFGRSGWVTAVVVALLLLSFGLVWRAHQRAQFHQLTTPVIPQTTSAPMPGGQEAMLLSRVALVDNAEPEFVSATVLPGIGMQLLQAAVAVPDQSSQNLFASLSVSDAARVPPVGVNSAPFYVRVSQHHLQVNGAGDDIVNFAPASDTKNQTLVDGGQVTGSFQGDAKAGTSATVEITLSGRQIDLIARVTNTTEENRFVAFEWAPRFAAPNGNLDQLGLLVPSSAVAGASSTSESKGTSVDFSRNGGQPVGNRAIDFLFDHLGRDFLSDGTFVRLQNGNRFFLRIVGMGDTLRSVRAKSNPASQSLLLSLSSIDPSAETDRHDQTLRPGQTMQWHLRMEVLPVKSSQAPETSR